MDAVLMAIKKTLTSLNEDSLKARHRLSRNLAIKKHTYLMD
jgi:hypothetical protein